MAYETTLHIQYHHAVVSFATDEKVVHEEDERAKKDHSHKTERYDEGAVRGELFKHELSRIDSQSVFRNSGRKRFVRSKYEDINNPKQHYQATHV